MTDPKCSLMTHHVAKAALRAGTPRGASALLGAAGAAPPTPGPTGANDGRPGGEPVGGIEVGVDLPGRRVVVRLPESVPGFGLTEGQAEKFAAKIRAAAASVRRASRAKT
jgi:hypothetical protein